FQLSLRVGTYEQVIPLIRDSLQRMQLDYMDLCLIHTPRNVLNLKNRDYLEIWRGLEEAKWLGLTRSIGVSNFNVTEINRILDNSKTPPAVNQIETNPTYTNLKLVAYCQSKSIIVTGYSPFGFLVPRPFNNLSLPPTFDDPILVGMAKKYCVKVSQIVLRYLVERHIMPIAGSLDKEHIKSNIDIFDFTLCPEDVLIINKFNKNIKVHLIDYDGLEEEMYRDYKNMKRFTRENNLQQYRNA
ncbi:aldo-keto reductase AKR2E4-like, partial [Maniola hyperantus]|uniref:aldo-keto reductase AKR2E4-like n=1 Tax=Aphantopus hyperantus TaxID=2795564 RepID=UPI00374A85D9